MDKERFEAGVAFARAWAQYVSQSFLGGETLAEALRWFYEQRVPVEDRQAFFSDMIGEARKFKSIWNGLNLLVQHKIRNGEALPPELAVWTADILADVAARRPPQSAPSRRGQDPHGKFLRNVVIVVAVERLVRRVFSQQETLRKVWNRALKAGRRATPSAWHLCSATKRSRGFGLTAVR